MFCNVDLVVVFFEGVVLFDLEIICLYVLFEEL